MTSKLNPTDVIAFLQAEPNFLVDHSADLMGVTLPQQAMADNVTLLGAYQAESLKKRLARLQEGTRSVIETSLQNLSHQNQIHTLTLDLLGCTTVTDVLDTLTSALTNTMQVDHVHLALHGELARRVDTREEVTALPEKKLHDLFADTSVVLRPIEKSADRVLHGASGHGLKSEALIRLFTNQGTLGVLALGAHDANRFAPEQNGDLLLFLGGVLGHQLWVVLNHA